jgi:twitching motility protein PilT
VDSSPNSDWHPIDDEGRAFLAEALASVEQAPSIPRDIPHPAAPGRLTSLLDAAIGADASDLHLSVDLPPHLRVNGVLRPLAGRAPLTADDLRGLLHEVLSAEQRQELTSTGDLDVGFTITSDSGSRRFRASVFRQSGSLAAAIRIVPSRIPSLTSLGLPPQVQGFVDGASGLVLVTGPTGSGKSTTLAAMIDEVNRTRVAHIITVEDPIEYRYTPTRSVIQQREVGADTASFAAALRRALRQDPDVILIGELRDLESIQIALTAAETGHLVLATLHSADATSAINRIIDVFPADQQAQIRSQMALSIRGCVSQRLLPRPDGALVPATEVMVATSAVRSLIRESKVHQLRSVLETGGDVGMHTFDQSLARLVRSGQLDLMVARGAAHSVPNLDALAASP